MGGGGKLHLFCVSLEIITVTKIQQENFTSLIQQTEKY